MIAHDLCTDHANRLGNHRIDLARHNRAAGLDCWQVYFANTSAGTRAKPTNIISDLHQAYGQRIKCATSLHDVIQRTLCLEMVACLADLDSIELRELLADSCSKILVGIDTCANG